ncbi:hypothetical protein BOX15_Mlig004629g1 [Macrostomum lignano]|uniref:Uncharacterized protein n=1 Tax=Macrostomum lignano TaxID=282301 RepID=A0A267FTY4_9PLAT|nr:hypothetical protein BOX15_Mlig004629g1 [Macrostomum lignano]
MSSATIKSQQSALEQSLPSIELLAYAAWFVIVLASVGHAFKTQIIPESLLRLDAASLTDGMFGYKMDNTFIDWNLYLSMFAPMLALLALHLLISRLAMRFCNAQVHSLLSAIFTLFVSCQVLSARCTLLYLCLHLICITTASLLGHLAVWLSIGLAFWQFSGAAFGDNHQLRSALQLDSRGAHLYYPVTGYLYCRFLSMGLCLAASPAFLSDSNPVRRIVRYLPVSLHYAFYLPNFLGAPVVTMDEFLRQKQAPNPAAVPVRQILSRLLRLCFWLAFTVFVLHCFHAGAYLETLGIRQIRHRGPIDPAHLGFALYTRGQLFHLEYLQYYGWPALFASLEGVQLPHWPACICGVVSYREMWRLFDRGLFAIVRDHVYIPLGAAGSVWAASCSPPQPPSASSAFIMATMTQCRSGYCSIWGSSALNCWLSDSTELRSGNLCSNGSARRVSAVWWRLSRRQTSFRLRWGFSFYSTAPQLGGW